MSAAVNLDDIFCEPGIVCDVAAALVADVHKLREIVLRDHRPPATLNDFCMECSGEWPCSSARAAGAT